MKCRACDCLMTGHAGWVVLEDGSKIEEEWCSSCRSIAFDEGSVNEKSFALEDITNEINSLVSKDGVTTPHFVPY